MKSFYYTLPYNLALVWLTDPRRVVPDDVRYNLIAHFFTAIEPAMMGALSVLIFNVIAYVRHPEPLFLLLLLSDVVLFVARFSLLFIGNRRVRQGRDTPTEAVLVLGILWCVHVGLGNALCFTADDNALKVLSIANMLGVAGGLVVRNHGCPRLAIVQISVCTLPFIFVLPFCADRILWVFAALAPIYLLGMASGILKLNGSYLTALLSEYENKRRASYDFLTELRNRQGLFAELSEQLQRLNQLGSLALFYLDLDGFKTINDTFGHAAGDDLLKQVADRLVAIAPRGSVVARLGGDEFVILVGGCIDSDAVGLAQTIVTLIKRPFDLGVTSEAHVGISVGIALTSTPLQPDALIASADRALYRAKAGGKGRAILADNEDLPNQLSA